MEPRSGQSEQSTAVVAVDLATAAVVVVASIIVDTPPESSAVEAVDKLVVAGKIVAAVVGTESAEVVLVSIVVAASIVVEVVAIAALADTAVAEAVRTVGVPRWIGTVSANRLDADHAVVVDAVAAGKASALDSGAEETRPDTAGCR